MSRPITHHSILQQVLQTCGCGGAITAVFLFHVLLHFLHLVLSVFHVGKELQGNGGAKIYSLLYEYQQVDSCLRFMFTSITISYLVVGCVFFEMSLSAAAQLEDPAPLSLQGSCEGLQETEDMMALDWLRIQSVASKLLLSLLGSLPQLSSCQGVLL